MAVTSSGFRWYDGFFLSMLAFSIIVVLMSWDRYRLCKPPLQLWIAVDYAVIFVFRVLMFVDNAIAAAVGLDYGRQLRGSRFFGRLAVLSIIYAVLYPFLWAWTVIGAVWFAGAKSCLPANNEKYGFVVWLVISFCGLICVAGDFGKKWFIRREAHLRRVREGTRVSEYGVLLNMIRQPEWVHETTVPETRDVAPDATTNNFSDPVMEILESMIQKLPIYILNAVPTDCSDCPICLEEFCIGQAVRGLPCAHNFHIACIDQWLRLNLRCPRCRCLVISLCQIHHASTTPVDPDHPIISTANPSYLARMQSFLVPVREENGPISDSSPSSSSSPVSTASNGDAPPPDSSPSPSLSPTSSNGPAEGPVEPLELVQ